MIARRIFGLIAILLTTLALLDAPSVEARRRRCHSDKPCKGGTCNDAGRCCGTSEFACGTSCCNALPGVACCDGACVDIRTESNCGGCDIVCHGGKFCTDGVCACRTGETDCNGFCANLLWDKTDCGACGKQCAAGLSCFLGNCRCPVGKELCNGQCIDVLDDANNCGGCGHVCPAAQECIAGACEPPCDEPCHGRVNNVCVPLCELGEVCDPNGQCQPSCPAGYTPCGGQCVATTPRGDGVCCQWQGVWHACSAGEQCAGAYCCGGGTEVCLGDGTNPQCCYNGLVCQAGRCCYPEGYPGCPGGTACCNYQ